MPFYKYVCLNEECETEVFEMKRKIADRNDPAQCPQCESECNRMENDVCLNSFVTGMYTARNGYSGSVDVRGRSTGGDLVPVGQAAASSTASKTHKK